MMAILLLNNTCERAISDPDKTILYHDDIRYYVLIARTEARVRTPTFYDTVRYITYIRIL